MQILQGRRSPPGRLGPLFACIRAHSRFILLVLGSVAAEPRWEIRGFNCASLVNVLSS